VTCTELTPKQTHRHTHSEETEESLFYFSVVLFYILSGSKIGGFQHVFTFSCYFLVGIEGYMQIVSNGIYNSVFRTLVIILELSKLVSDTLKQELFKKLPLRDIKYNHFFMNLSLFECVYNII